MKRILIAALSLFFFASAALAQPRAVGIRAGGAGVDVLGLGVELSYQHTLGNNFIEGDLGFSRLGIGVSGTYDFTIVDSCFGVQNMVLYAGPGVNVGVYENTFLLGVAAQVGLEYQIGAIPLSISLDWRPSLYIVPNIVFSGAGLGIGIRYRF